MSAATITRDDALKIRKNLESSGRPVPDALKAATDPAPEPTPPVPAPGPTPAVPGRGAAPAPARRAATAKPAVAVPTSHPLTRRAPVPRAGQAPASRGRRAPVSRGGRVGRRRSSGKSLGKRLGALASNPATLGGDGGGLFLALWLYPLVLATLQHGASGPGIWMRAKFLNIGTSDGKPAKPKLPGPTTPGGSGGAGGKFGSGGGGLGPMVGGTFPPPAVAPGGTLPGIRQF